MFMWSFGPLQLFGSDRLHFELKPRLLGQLLLLTDFDLQRAARSTGISFNEASIIQ